MNVILPFIIIVNNLIVQGPASLLIVGYFMGLKSKFCLLKNKGLVPTVAKKSVHFVFFTD